MLQIAVLTELKDLQSDLEKICETQHFEFKAIQSESALSEYLAQVSRPDLIGLVTDRDVEPSSAAESIKCKTSAQSWNPEIQKFFVNLLNSQKAVSDLTTQIANLKRNQNTYLHELRNSIFAIEAAKQRILKGLAHQCQDDPWIIETKQKLSRISNALERINVISEEAAAGSSQGIGSSIQDRLKTCFVKPLIDSTVDEMPSHLKEEVSISIHVPDGLNVTASETHLELVFINLLKNALEAVEGSMKPWVKVIAESDKSSTIILFVDSGRGIDDASKAFTWQYSTKRKSGGKGVGLKLAKAYAERMNGRVYYRLYDSKHTCFCVEIFHS